MNALNGLLTKIFDVILVPLEFMGNEMALILLSGIFGVLALVVFKYISSQKGIKAAKDKIKGHMIAIRLYQNDLVVVAKSIAKVLLRNLQYVSLNFGPFIPLAPLFVFVVAQTVVRYGFEPLHVVTVEEAQVMLPGQGTMLQIEFKDDDRSKAGELEIVWPEGLMPTSKLVRIPSQGKAWQEFVAIAPGDYEVQQIDLIEESDRALLVTNSPEDPAVRQLRLIHLGDAEQRVLTGDDGCAAGSGWSRGSDPARPHVSHDGSTVVYMWETLGRPGDLYSQALPAGQNVARDPAVRLTDFVPDALDELALVQPEIISYANPDDGTLVRAFLYLPEPYDPTERYPLVVFVHGAGYLQNVTRSETAYEVDKLFHHRLARKGYVVLAPDFRHSAGYGRNFRADIHGYMGGKDTDDVVAGIAHLELLGLIDTERVGVYGGSYGGFLTLMCLARYPDSFACGAALRSVTDWRTYHAGYTNPRLGHPERDAENYERSSPIDLVDDIQDPVLMLHGLKDDNVFAQDSIRFIEELIQRGKVFDAMLYPSQAHGFTDPESWVDEYGRIEGYMDRYLGAESVRTP